MKLKYNKTVNESVVTVTLNLTGFTVREKKAIRVLGAPDIEFEEAYQVSGTTIAIDCPITEFNSLEPFVFKGDPDNIADVLDEVSGFITSIHDVLCDIMTETMLNYKQIEKITNSVSGEMPVNDGDCHTPEQQEE